MGTNTNIDKILKVFEAKKGGSLFDDSPRGVLELLLIGGGLVATLTFAPTLLAAIAGAGYLAKAKDRARRKRINNSLQYLKRRDYVRVVTKKDQKGIRIELTKRGRWLATKAHLKKVFMQPILRPRVWDKRWRVIMFDIATQESSKRTAFRRLIRDLGAVMMQKSVWLYPFDCSSQLGILKDLFDLTDSELRVVLADSIGNDVVFRKHFKL